MQNFDFEYYSTTNTKIYRTSYTMDVSVDGLRKLRIPCQLLDYCINTGYSLRWSKREIGSTLTPEGEGLGGGWKPEPDALFHSFRRDLKIYIEKGASTLCEESKNSTKGVRELLAQN